jgi:5,10-methylene-tetrahydrofolate dehydrogenase/methenyl tetrahydrofolate cyclohydrolase
MECKLIDGKKIAKQIRQEMYQKIYQLKGGTDRGPVLAVFLIGNRKDSETYVRMKRKACEEVGMSSVQYTLSESIPQKELIAKIREHNKGNLYNGILVQLPLPDHIDTDAVIQSIDPTKDVDGLHILNQGELFTKGHHANMIPCTPKGCLELLDRYHIPIEGKRAVVLGRSRLVGKPIAQLLLSRNATVTQCHSRTQDLEKIIGTAEILVSCMGKPNFVKGEWLRSGVPNRRPATLHPFLEV